MIVYKGKETEFKIKGSFVDPMFEIRTPIQQLFFKGKPEMAEKDIFTVRISVPNSAPESVPGKFWTLKVYDDKKEKTFYFDVASSEDPTSREIIQAGFKGPIKIKNYFTEPVKEMTLFAEDTELKTVKNFDVKNYGKFKVYQTEQNLEVDNYIVRWTTENDIYWQTLIVLPVSGSRYITAIRHLLDRVQKESDEPQYFYDSDIAVSMVMGLELINSWPPITTWSWSSCPELIRTFYPYAAGYWLLNSQYMVETDLAFNYSGNEVNLDYDRTGPIESMMGRLKEQLTENLQKTKKAVLRKQPGIVALTNSGIGPNPLTIRWTPNLIRRW